MVGVDGDNDIELIDGEKVGIDLINGEKVVWFGDLDLVYFVQFVRQGGEKPHISM